MPWSSNLNYSGSSASSGTDSPAEGVKGSNTPWRTLPRPEAKFHSWKVEMKINTAANKLPAETVNEIYQLNKSASTARAPFFIQQAPL